MAAAPAWVFWTFYFVHFLFIVTCRHALGPALARPETAVRSGAQPKAVAAGRRGMGRRLGGASLPGFGVSCRRVEATLFIVLGNRKEKRSSVEIVIIIISRSPKKDQEQEKLCRARRKEHPAVDPARGRDGVCQVAGQAGQAQPRPRSVAPVPL